MSQQTQSGIQLLIDARIADNNSKDISAGDVREVLTAINESFNGPIMIYHGQLKARNGAGNFVATIKDYYVNLAHPGTGTGVNSRFVLSTSAGEGSHTEDNTLIQASAVNISQQIEYIKNQMITTNELNSYLKGVTSNDAWPQNVTLWRVA